MKFNEDVRLYVPPEQLWTEFNGDVTFEYDHSVYWPALLALCEERHAEQKARWVAAGKRLGESESVIKASEAIPSAAPSEAAPVQVVAEEKAET